ALPTKVLQRGTRRSPIKLGRFVILSRKRTTGNRQIVPIVCKAKLLCPCCASFCIQILLGTLKQGNLRRMVNRNLFRQFDLAPDELKKELDEAFFQGDSDWLPAEEQEFRDNRVVTGKVRKVTADDVWVDVGYKSEGAVELREW